MTSTVQEKFTNLRKRLDQLGYRQPLGVESLPLCERLFADLLHTTESLKKVKLQTKGRGPVAQADVEGQIEPYKNDNARLVKENNELHVQLIKAKEDSDKKIAEFKALMKKIEHENNDLKFLNNQYVHKIRAQERENNDKSAQILKLQEKNFNAVIQTPGGKSKRVPFRRQRLLLDSTVPPSVLTPPPSAPPRDDPFIADLLAVADQRIAELEHDLALTCDANTALEGKMATFRRQVESRDAEINRLGRVLDGGRPHDVVALEARNRSNEKLISHLNIQIDYLQQKNAELEKRCESAVSKESAALRDAANADLQCSELERSLKDADRTTKRLEHDREAVIGAADRELSEAKIELERFRQDLEQNEEDNRRLIQTNDMLKHDNSKLKDELLSRSADFQRLENLVDKTQQDKKKLGMRVNKLMSTEKELVVELEKLKRCNKSYLASSKVRNRSPNRFDQLIKNLEQERNYWKQEVERLQEVLTYKKIGGVELSPSRSRRSFSISPKRSPTSKSPSRHKSPSSRPVDKLEREVQTLTEERDFYKLELENMKVNLRQTTPKKTLIKSGKSLNVERNEITHERDELLSEVSRLEQQLSEMRRNGKILSNERNRLQELYDDTKDELHRVRSQLLTGSTSKSPSLAAQHVLKRVEQEKDEAMGELRSCALDRDRLRERLQIATDEQLAERRQLDARLEELSSRVSRLNTENGQLESQMSSLRSHISQLEDEIRLHETRYSEAMDNFRLEKDKSNQMRMVADDTDKSMRDTKQRLMIKEDEVSVLTQRCQELEDRLKSNDNYCTELKQEVNQLRNTITALDREKDSMQSLLDEKTERCARLDDECVSQEDRANQLLRNSRDVARQLEHAEDTIKLKEREIHTLRKQLDSSNIQLSDANQAKDEQLRENKLLEEDLNNMTVENQRLSQDIQELIDERGRLTDQMQEYIADVKRVEDVLARKEEERSQLLEQYQRLSADAERYETQTNQLEHETHNMRRSLEGREAHIKRIEEQMTLLDREFRQTQLSHEALESQSANQTRAINNLEDQIRELEKERYDMQQDMVASRDLSARIETSKEQLQRRLANKEVECERLSTEIEEMNREILTLKDRNNSDRQELNSLEQLLANNREKEFQSQLQVHETISEVQLLRDRLTLNDSKIDSQNREITQLRNRIVELEADVERSRHQITNERFERERTAQELRRTQELSRSSALSASAPRSAAATPSIRSGRTTPISIHTPSKITSPMPSRQHTTSYQSSNLDVPPAESKSQSPSRASPSSSYKFGSHTEGL